jgi:hypothetical protein
MYKVLCIKSKAKSFGNFLILSTQYLILPIMRLLLRGQLKIVLNHFQLMGASTRLK